MNEGIFLLLLFTTLFFPHLGGRRKNGLSLSYHPDVVVVVFRARVCLFVVVAHNGTFLGEQASATFCCCFSGRIGSH